MNGLTAPVGMCGAHVCGLLRELGAAFPSHGPCGSSMHTGDFCPWAIPLPLVVIPWVLSVLLLFPLPPPQGPFGTDWGHSGCLTWRRTLSPDTERVGVLLCRGRAERPRSQDSFSPKPTAQSQNNVMCADAL